MKKNHSENNQNKNPSEEVELPGKAPLNEQPSASESPDLQAEVERYRDQALRSAADLENYRKRMIREKEEALRYANAALLERLLPILDNFELGLDAARSETAAIGIVNGLSMVHRQLGDFLVSSGLQPIDAVGQPFDPKLHEALGHESDPSQPDGVVLRQLRRGYVLSGRLIRPSSVIVNKA